MGTPAQPGKREFVAALKKARLANCQLRELLKRLLHEGTPGIQILVGRASLMLLDNENALNRLEEIGRNSSRRNHEPGQ